MTAGDHYPQIFPGLGSGVLIACLSAAGCLWAGSGGWCGCRWHELLKLTWMMLQIVSYINYYSVYTSNMCLI